MSDNKPAEVDVTKEWRATHGQKSAAPRLRIFAAIAWVIAIGGEITGIVLLRQHKFDHGHLGLLLGILLGIAIFALAGSLMRNAAQAQDIARDSAAVAEATKDPAHTAGLDVVYWIAPENGAQKAATPHVFHICQSVRPLRGKTVHNGSVTKAYAENATRITKQIPMEQKQCGFGGSTPDNGVAPAA